MADDVSHRVDSGVIVVGVDGSDGSDRALEWAINEALDSKRNLLLVHVSSVQESAVLAPIAPLVADATTYADELLSRLSSRCEEAGVRHSVATLYGSPAERLTEVSADAAMLVIGARGHGPPPRMIFGSVTEGCLHRFRCPLLLVKHPKQDR